MSHPNLKSRSTVIGRLLACATLLAGAIGLAAPTETEAAEQAETKTYALIVANNESVDSGVKPLEYADDDGARYWEMFDSFADEATLLATLDADSQRIFPEVARQTKPATKEQLERTVGRLAEQIERDRRAGIESELYLIFTGHGSVDDSGEGYLSLADSKLHRSDLYRDIVEPLDASYTHMIVDACHAYFMVHSRGGGEGEGWEDDRSGQTLNKQLSAYLADRDKETQQTLQTVGVIVSTAGNAEVHEWSRYRAGVFSHQLRSGLLGAADADGDGDITYREMEAYLVAANAAVTNPRARIDVYAHPPKQDRRRRLTSLDDFEEATILEIPAGMGGKYHLEDSRGLRYADFHVDGATPTRVALLQEPVSGGTYYLRKKGRQAKIPLDRLTVQSSELAYNDVTQQARGSVDEAFRTELFKTPFGPSFVAGFRAGRDSAAGMAEPTPSTDEPKEWSVEAGLGYGMGRTPSWPGLSDSGRLQHQVDARATFRHDSGWGLGPFANWGGSFYQSGQTLHRGAVGLEGSYRLPVAGGFSIAPLARVGHALTLLNDGDTLRSDPVGLHTAAAVDLRFALSDRLTLFAQPGVAADLFTVDQPAPEPNDERWMLRPTGTVGVVFGPNR